MEIFTDYEGREVRLTDAAREHIALRHPEIVTLGLEAVIGETLHAPDIVIERSRSFHYHRWYTGTEFGDKFVRVIVEIKEGERHVSTAYVTNGVRKGRVIWERR